MRGYFFGRHDFPVLKQSQQTALPRVKLPQQWTVVGCPSPGGFRRLRPNGSKGRSHALAEIRDKAGHVCLRPSK